MKFFSDLLLLVLLIHVLAQDYDEEEPVSLELMLADYDISDAYDDVSEATKKMFSENQGYKYKIKMEKERGKLVRVQSEKNRNFESDVPYDIMRNWTLLTNTGDLLLSEPDFNMLINFHNVHEKLSYTSKVPCIHSKLDNCTINKQNVSDILASNRNMNELNETWSMWQNVFSANKSQFIPTLHLLNKVFIPNEEHSVRSYWEMLSEYPEGYSKAQALWEEIEPLYKKLHKFVQIRISNYYNISQDDPMIPVYLLGSNFGTDWSNIASVVLPHPFLYYEVTSELKYRTITEIYELVEETIKKTGLGELGDQFWNKSKFNASFCGPHVFSNCRHKQTEIITCSKLGWLEYLDAHEAAIKVILRNQDYPSLARRSMRYSAVDEALQNLGSIIALDNLAIYDFIPKNTFTEQNDVYNRRNTALLLMALRILPKLPYYLLADISRLDELEFSYGNFTEKWWLKRNEMQGVCGTTNVEYDFLGDPLITSNKPYLSKFFGTFLQFQLLDHFQRYFATESGTTVDYIARDENFLSFVYDRANKKWPDLLTHYYGMDEISSSSLLEYFKPLEQYLDTAPLQQVIYSTTPKPRTTKTTVRVTRKNKTKGKDNGSVLNYTNSSINNEVRQQTKTSNDNSTIHNNNNNNKSNVTSETNLSGQMGVIIGIISIVVVGIVLIVVVQRLKKKKKKKTNNRRFET